jgi:hypothetical protein
MTVALPRGSSATIGGGVGREAGGEVRLGSNPIDRDLGSRVELADFVVACLRLTTIRSCLAVPDLDVLFFREDVKTFI